MLEKVKNELLKRADKVIDKYNVTIDLKMKNGHNVTVYLPSKVNSAYAIKDFAVLTDDEILKFTSIEDIANWIIVNYSCTKYRI